MRRAALKMVSSQFGADDQTAMTAALNRLYGAATQSVGDIVDTLTQSERAKLAVFCYGRAHLNTIGLAIAARCDLDHLIAASSSATAGHTIFTQSRETPAKSASGRRPAITLASSVTRAALDVLPEPAELIA